MDFVGVKLAQRADAKAQFGTFKSTDRGMSNVDVPDIDGVFAQRVRTYWRNEASRLRQHVLDLPDSAIVSQWMRAVDALNDRVALPSPIGFPVVVPKPTPLNAEIDRKAGIGRGALLTSLDAQAFWNLIDAVVNPMQGLKDTPTKWDIFVESVEEAAAEALDFGGDMIGKLVLVVGLVAGAYLIKELG